MRRFILIILLVLTPALLVADYHTYKLQLEEAVAKKEQYIKDFEAAGILRLRAIMVAKCKDYYEISFQGNDRALLFTHDSVFSSPGNFSLLAKKIRTKRVTTKDGWEQEFDAFEELTEEETYKYYKASFRTVISSDGWKLTLSDVDKNQLFNLNEDKYECNNLYYLNKYNEIIYRLKEQICSWQQRTGDKLKISI